MNRGSQIASGISRFRIDLLFGLFLLCVVSSCERRDSDAGGNSAKDASSSNGGHGSGKKESGNLTRIGSETDIGKARNASGFDKDAANQIQRLVKEHPDQLCGELLKLGRVPPPEFFEQLVKEMGNSNTLKECLDSFTDSVNAGNALSVDIAEALVFQLGKANLRSDEVIKRIAALGSRNGTDTVLTCFAAGLTTVLGKQMREVIDLMDIPLSLKSSVIGRLVRNSESMSGLSPMEKIEMLQGLDKHEVSLTEPFIMENWLKTDQEAALSYLAGLGAEKSGRLLGNGWFLQKLIDIDPKTCVSMLSALPATESNSKLLRDGLRLLALRDSAEAKKLLDGFPNNGTWDGLRVHAISSMIVDTDADTVKKVSAVFGENNEVVSRGIVRGLAQHDIAKALDFVKTLPDGGTRDVNREIARTAALSSPDTAVALLSDSAFAEKIGPGFRSEMLDNTVRTWANQDRDAAQAWVEKLPEQDLPKGVNGLMISWMKTDPVAASEWLAKLPAGPARDAGARQIIQQVKNTDPEMAEQWRKSLTPPPSK